MVAIECAVVVPWWPVYSNVKHNNVEGCCLFPVAHIWGVYGYACLGCMSVAYKEGIGHSRRL